MPKMMNIISKKMLLATLLVVSGGIGAVTLAQVDVKSNLTNAVQNIQKVYFMDCLVMMKSW